MSTKPTVTADMEYLIRQPQFLRFLYRMISQSALLEAKGLDRLEYYEGRRSLALELLADAEQGLPDKSADGVPLFVAIQIFQQQAQSAPHDRRRDARYDRSRDLGTDAEADAESDAG